jgi:glycerol uptake facilitator-like aquaporin
VPPFIAAQIIGALAGLALTVVLYPDPGPDRSAQRTE